MSPECSRPLASGLLELRRVLLGYSVADTRAEGPTKIIFVELIPTFAVSESHISVPWDPRG